MSTNFSDTLRTARGNAIIAAIDAGTGVGTMKFYTGTKPSAKGAAITTQVLLATCGFSEPAGTCTDGVITFATVIDDTSVDADGIATWARVLDGDGNFVIDWTVTDNAGAGPVKMPNTQMYAGGNLHASSIVITEGNA